MRRLSFGILALIILTLATRPLVAADPDSTGVVVDKEKRTILVDARIAPRKINDERYKEIYPIEVVACYPFPRGQKAHETVVTIDAKPSAVHKGLIDLGLKPGTPVVGDAKDAPQGPEVKIFLELPGEGGAEAKRVPLERTLLDIRTNKPLPPLKWRFTGSIMRQPDPTKDEKVYGADMTGTLISIFPVTAETVFQTNLTMKEEKFVKLETDKKLLPPEGTKVKLVIVVPGP
jgi:hypothetical protein